MPTLTHLPRTTAESAERETDEWVEIKRAMLAEAKRVVEFERDTDATPL